ncbi:hypothetical protein [Marinoscillum sp. MHG1-6]|uniref:hypothetical protein n=1 Tax=Marinoscillum sp. MHG1-6 TaxID=2959627 RepID=UPI002157A41F|nr:hypothetical protein [Marinoscillum sp. MHG1-6]
MNTDIMVGMSHNSTNDPSWNTIDYNCYVSGWYNGDKILLYEKGVYKYTYPDPYQVGDLITIHKSSQSQWVYIYHNSKYIGGFNTGTYNYLYFDSSIYHPEAIIQNIGTLHN